MEAALQHFQSVTPWLLMMLGTALGITVGAVPGLTGAMLIALTLPLTFSMDGPNALTLLVSMYVGSISGGLITATLLRMPGTPASMMTTLDGYPMARSGKPGRALGLGINASFIGGLISFFFLVLLSKPIAELATKLDSFDLFSLVLTALVLIASVSGKSMLAGILSGFIGILFSFPGTNEATGELRYTFGIPELNGGFNLLPVLIGLFAVSQVLKDIIHYEQEAESIPLNREGLFLKLHEWKAQFVNLIRSSLIGTWIGILPGIGANIGSVMAYSAAKSMSKDPDKFGKGSEEGIVASEAANNATVGGALIPLIAMGIPGSVIDAILLGAMTIHGLTPGPLLFDNNPDIVYTMMIAVFLANIFMLFFMILMVNHLAKLMYVPGWILVPLVLVFCVVGSHALYSNIFDVWVMLAFGLVGFGMEKLKIPLAPFVIGFILAPVAESNLTAGLMVSDGSYTPIFTQPVSCFFFVLSMILLFWPIIRHWRKYKKGELNTEEYETSELE